MSGQPMCFICKVRPAGNALGGSCSAYCAGCQPRAGALRLRGGQCGCGVCGRVFATLTDFDAHQVRRDGVFAGACLDPVSLGLEAAGGVWGTPDGNAHRAKLAARLPAAAAVVRA